MERSIPRPPETPARGSNGGGAPLAVRKGPGNLYGMVPRRVFPPFLRGEKWGRPQAKRPRPASRPRRSGRFSCGPADSPLGSAGRSAVPSPPAGNFLCPHKESHQRNALKGTCAGAVPLRIPPRLPRGLRPHWIPQRGFTGDGGLWRAENGSICYRLVFVNTDARYSTFSSTGRVPSTWITGQSTVSSHFST